MEKNCCYDITAAYELENKRLKVDILQPGTEYNRSRFDWTGFITRVELDRAHTFCVPESLIPGKGCGGEGFCNEFGIFEPVGYEETPVGGQFPKLGIGLLTRSDQQDYQFFRDYEIQPFTVDVSQGADWITFIVNPTECNGYAVRLEKTIRLEENWMTLEYHLHNTGSKKIKTHEYCHNFIGIDGHSVGPDYQLKFPYEVKTEAECPILNIEGNVVSWKAQPDKDFYCRLKEYEAVKGHRWEMIHVPSGVGVREYSDFDVAMIALWGKGYIISPEIFVQIDLNPGGTFSWSRRYEFFAR